jgi:cation transport ATPase
LIVSFSLCKDNELILILATLEKKSEHPIAHAIVNYAKEKNTEVIGTGEEYVSGAKKGQEKTTQGSLYGKLTNFVNRLENKINDNRLDFLLAQKSKDITFEETLNQLIGYQTGKQSNVTVIDLSGVPFEVLSITVSLISRI